MIEDNEYWKNQYIATLESQRNSLIEINKVLVKIIYSLTDCRAKENLENKNANYFKTDV